MDEAEATEHALTLCHALAQAACSVALFNGDVAGAAGFTAILVDRSRELGLAGWIARGHCFQGTVLIMQGDFAAGLPMLREALDELRESGAAPGHPTFLGVLARGLGQAGQVSGGLTAIDQALALSERHEERSILPELLRNKGELCARGVGRGGTGGRGLLPASTRLGAARWYALIRTASLVQPWPLIAR